MSTELTKVVLVGSLGQAVGLSEWHLDVKSPREALRAIDINTRGKLEAYLSGPARDRLYRIALQKRDNVIDAKAELGNRSGRSTIYIMPTVRGRNSGVGKVIAGIVLVALAIVSQQYELLPGILSGGVGLVGGAAGGIIAGFGVSLILGGISQILAPKPQGPNASPEQAQSTGFPGNAGAVSQGSAIPVVYGRALVSPTPVAVTTTNNDVSSTSAGTLGDVTTTNLQGGGQQNSATDYPT